MFVDSDSVLEIGASCVHITCLDVNGRPLSTASGAFLKVGERQFLVSNKHVFSGIDVNTGFFLSKDGAVPTAFSVKYNKIVDNISVSCSTHIDISDENGEHVWFCSKSNKTFDVAAIDLDKNIFVNLVYVNNDSVLDMQGNDSKLPPVILEGSELFILGYPAGITDDFARPIWKRASLATHLKSNFMGQPRFLVDTASSAGMSGAPVIFHSMMYRVRNVENEISNFYHIGSSARVWLGIYSGRLKALIDDPAGAQLGVVWRADEIEKMILEKIENVNYITVSVNKNKDLNFILSKTDFGFK